MPRWCGFLFLLTAIMSGCSAYVVRGPADEASPYYKLPVGSVFVLHWPVTIAPTYARAFFQDGRAVRAVSELVPHCQLRVRQVLPIEQTIRPDEFVMERVAGKTMEVVAIPGMPLAHGGSGAWASDIMLAWEMRLHSAAQPDVLKLVCAGALDSPSRARPPSVKQIRATLGGYAGLRLP